MKVIILITHAEGVTASHTHQLAHAAEEFYKENGIEYKVIDVANEGLGEVLSYKDFDGIEFGKLIPMANKPAINQKWKDMVEVFKWSTHVLVFGSMWWGCLPGSFYCFFQKLLLASSLQGGLFEKSCFYGRKAMIVSPVGNIQPNYTHGTGISSFDGIMFQSIFGNFVAAGFTPIKSYPICGILMMTPEKFNEEVQKFKEVLKTLDSREIIKLPWDAKAREGMPDSVVTLAEGNAYQKP